VQADVDSGDGKGCDQAEGISIVPGVNLQLST
jgi:hypothetical protein